MLFEHFIEVRRVVEAALSGNVQYGLSAVQLQEPHSPFDPPRRDIVPESLAADLAEKGGKVVGAEARRPGNLLQGQLLGQMAADIIHSIPDGLRVPGASVGKARGAVLKLADQKKEDTG